MEKTIDVSSYNRPVKSMLKVYFAKVWTFQFGIRETFFQKIVCKLSVHLIYFILHLPFAITTDSVRWYEGVPVEEHAF